MEAPLRTFRDSLLFHPELCKCVLNTCNVRKKANKQDAVVLLQYPSLKIFCTASHSTPYLHYLSVGEWKAQGITFSSESQVRFDSLLDNPLSHPLIVFDLVGVPKLRTWKLPTSPELESANLISETKTKPKAALHRELVAAVLGDKDLRGMALGRTSLSPELKTQTAAPPQVDLGKKGESEDWIYCASRICGKPVCPRKENTGGLNNYCQGCFGVFCDKPCLHEHSKLKCDPFDIEKSIAAQHKRYCENCKLDSSETSEAVKLRRCGACKVAYYCSLACQREHYPAHKAGCQKAAALRLMALSKES